MSSRGWLVFKSEQDIEVAWNDARMMRDAGMEERLTRSSLDLAGFRNAIENRYPVAVFGVNVATYSPDQAFELRLVADDFGYVLAKVRDLLLSGVVTHCSLDLVMAGSKISAERCAHATGPAGWRRVSTPNLTTAGTGRVRRPCSALPESPETDLPI